MSIGSIQALLSGSRAAKEADGASASGSEDFSKALAGARKPAERPARVPERRQEPERAERPERPENPEKPERKEGSESSERAEHHNQTRRAQKSRADAAARRQHEQDEDQDDDATPNAAVTANAATAYHATDHQDRAEEGATTDVLDDGGHPAAPGQGTPNAQPAPSGAAGTGPGSVLTPTLAQQIPMPGGARISGADASGIPNAPAARLAGPIEGLSAVSRAGDGTEAAIAALAAMQRADAAQSTAAPINPAQAPIRKQGSLAGRAGNQGAPAGVTPTGTGMPTPLPGATTFAVNADLAADRTAMASMSGVPIPGGALPGVAPTGAAPTGGTTAARGEGSGKGANAVEESDGTKGTSAGLPAGFTPFGAAPTQATTGPDAPQPVAPTPRTPEPPVSDQVTRHLVNAKMLSDGSHTTILHLRPEALGPVTVTVTVNGGDVQMGLAGSPDAIAALQADLDGLREQLSDSGLNLGDVSYDKQQAQPDLSQQNNPQNSGSADSFGQAARDAAGNGGQNGSSQSRGTSDATDGTRSAGGRRADGDVPPVPSGPVPGGGLDVRA